MRTPNTLIPRHLFPQLPAAKPKAKAKEPSEMAYRGKLHASERRSLKRSLEPAKAKAMSLGGSVVARIIGRNMPPLTHTMRHFFASGAVFFRRSRLFFREAAFSSGGEGCEWRAPRATVGESGDKAENEFSGFIPLAVPRKGFSPHIPASRLFVHFHTTMPTSPPNPSSIHQVESIQSVGSVGSVGSIASIPPQK